MRQASAADGRASAVSLPSLGPVKIKRKMETKNYLKNKTKTKTKKRKETNNPV